MDWNFIMWMCTQLSKWYTQEMYMKQAIGYEKEGEEHLECKLRKSIYGLKQASRRWNVALDSHLQNMGFMHSINA